MQHNETLQALCRGYLRSLRHLAKKHGIDVDAIIRANKRKECSGTEYECQMLSRMVDDERIARTEIPQMLNKSYRQCCDDEDFERIKKLRRVGIYSKVSAILYAKKRKKEKQVKKNK